MKTQPQHTRPRPGRRRQFSSSLPFSSTYIYIFTAMIVSLFCIPASAHEQHGHYQASKDHLVSRRADILFDAGPRPIPALYRRAAASSPSDIAAPSATAKAAATSIISQSTSTDTALPVPFDGGLGANFTQPSCPTFIRAMVNNSTFTSCLPFSLLLQNSVSFFSATRTIPTITHVLNASCSVVYPDCSNLISSYALTLRSSSACSQDYDRQNPIVRQAYAGLISYDILYQASCIKNVPVANTPISDDNNYCYANAVTNTSSPSDNYVYYLPLGIPLPAAALPTCDGCLKNTMAVFAAAAANKSQPLSLDYVDAATMINQDCGPDFVNGTIPSIGSSGTGTGQTSAAIVSASVGSWMIALGMVIAVQLFVS